MTKSIKKDFRREIKKGISRFISILLIVVLGVAFYSGIRSSMPAMQMTADAVYDKENFMDIRVVGTLGLTQNDLNAIKEIEGVKDVEGAFTTDFLCLANSSEIVTKVLAMPENINTLQVIRGDLPKAYNECIVSSEFLTMSGYKVGDSITLITGTDDNVFDTLASETYKIVGVCSSSYFLNGDMGTSTIGDGVVDGYVVVPRDAFVTDIYSSIYITVEGASELDSYSKDYTAIVNRVIQKIKLIADKCCDIRYSEVRSQSNEMLEDAKNDYLDAEITVQNELAEAYQELLDNEKLYEEERANWEENLANINSAEANLPAYRKQIEEAEKKIAAAEIEVAEKKTELEEIEKKVNTLETQYEEYISNPNVSESDIKNAKDTLTFTKSVYTFTKNSFDTKAAELESAKKELESKKKTLADLEEAVANKGALINGGEELDKAKEELERGREKYEIAKQDAEQELADAKKKLADAENEINTIEIPIWHVLSRDSVESYVSFKNDTQSIGAIGTVFPVIFFLVAALVALTTMTRMVEEQRTQIGVLKALGYSKFTIIGKYIRYALLASVIGSVLGVALGEFTIPYLLVSAYKTTYYNLGDAVVTLNIVHALVASFAAIICTIGATFFAVFKELRAVPAELMRPEAPKAGKRILLEKINFIWERLNFGQKAAMRNLFRYKKRFFMTIFGVGGCMALLLVGFGVRDSVAAMANNQYGKVLKYDALVTVDSTLTRSQRRTMLADISGISDVTDYIQVNRTMVYATGKSANDFADEKNAYMIVPRDIDKFEEYISLCERGAEVDELALSDEGVIITEKYANMLNVSVGDGIFIRLSESDAYPKEVKVVGITENYIFNYIYMTPNLYHTLYSVMGDLNVIMLKMEDATNIEDISSRLLSISGINSVTMNEDDFNELNTVINSLYFIVVIMIIAAAILAFVVLYNLNNINISERKRELATLKLLGFYDGELNSYISRENVVLTLLGTILGVFIGILLHQFVMITVETDVYMFGRELNPVSIVISAALTILFSLITNLIMYFKMQKIDMIESLKSVE
ncbi:MAG: FtsX-like permease family protein [Clostridia bacterium]|nr:FtsX-like permease family protein [Clostridia bacterium]